MKKTITIKNALVTDREYMDSLKTKPETSAADCFSLLVIKAKTASSNEVSTETTADYEEETGQLKQSIVELNSENAKFKASLAKETELKDAALSEAERLRARITELEAELANKAAEPKGVVLTGMQFICELSEKNSRNARKIRSFVKKEGYYEPQENETPTEYINALVNLSVPFFMKRNFADHID